jgi:hypothetical protein
MRLISEQQHAAHHRHEQSGRNKKKNAAQRVIACSANVGLANGRVGQENRQETGELYDCHEPPLWKRPAEKKEHCKNPTQFVHHS